MERENFHIEPGAPMFNKGYSIIIDTKGPYFVYGKPTLRQEFIVSNAAGEAWEYKPGITYKVDHEPMVLCRCGHSQTKPFCDGSHTQIDWDPTLSADRKPLLDNVEISEGEELQLLDNKTYCVHARFCMARGTVWQLTEDSDNTEAHDLAVHESMYCPSGRLKLWDKEEEKFYEPPLKPALGLIEDPQEECSGPLWVKGGIPVNGPNGTEYEQRNRVTLCRCGASANKPYCDGTHVTVHFQDHLPLSTELEEKMK